MMKFQSFIFKEIALGREPHSGHPLVTSKQYLVAIYNPLRELFAIYQNTFIFTIVSDLQGVHRLDKGN